MYLYMKLCVDFWSLLLICIWFLHCSVRADYYGFVRRYPGRLCFVRVMTYSGVMLCYGSRDLAIGPGSVYGVMLWYGLWYVWWYDMLCLGMYGDLKPSGVMLCVAPASEWWPRSWALCMISICIMYMFSVQVCYTDSVFSLLILLLSYDLDFCTLCFTYSVHLSYWPPFFGGCVSCPQVQWFAICQCRPHILLLQSAPFDSEPMCWYLSFVIYMFLYIWLFGVRRGPVPSYDFVMICRGL